MPPKLNAEYSEMLYTPVPLDGPRKDTIESLQKQIDFYFGEIYRLKRTQNSHVAISRLPAEMLSEIFLYVVEDGIENAVRFAAGTFNFLQICKRWNEVAINFPRLWVWWIPGAVKAWPLFNTRAKNVPLFLTVRSYVPILTKDAVMNPAIPRKIHQLDFAGTQQQLVDFLDAIGSNPPSNAWSIRLQVPPSNYSKLLEHLARFLSSPFPKLSKLDIEDFTPDSTSPIFTTSNLTSLKLSLSLTGKFRYTLSQFSQILQHHPNLRELDLQQSGTTVPEPSGPLVPLVLPRLVDLRLYSTEPTITGLIDLIGVSSPLHNVVIHFQNGYTLTPSLTNTMKKILAAYHGCAGLDSPRTVNHLSISSRLLEGGLTIDAESHSTSASQPMSNLRLQFDRTWDGLVGKILPLFQLNHVREFTVTRLGLVMGDWRRMFRKMKRLLCLRLDSLDIKPALEALCFDDPDNPSRLSAPKLQSLTFSNLDILFDVGEELPNTLAWRREHNIGLKKLVVRSCRVHSDEGRVNLEKLVKKVTWEDVRVMGSDYEGTDIEGETDSDYDDDDYWGDRMYRFPFY